MSHTQDSQFIEQQRRRLETLRDELQRTLQGLEQDQQQLHRNREEPQDTADEAAELKQLDTDRAKRQVEALRLQEVERALEKIEQGSYGQSDVSGEPIPRERLEARPAALCTVEEEEQRERERRQQERAGR